MKYERARFSFYFPSFTLYAENESTYILGRPCGQILVRWLYFKFLIVATVSIRFLAFVHFSNLFDHKTCFTTITNWEAKCENPWQRKPQFKARFLLNRFSQQILWKNILLVQSHDCYFDWAIDQIKYITWINHTHTCSHLVCSAHIGGDHQQHKWRFSLHFVLMHEQIGWYVWMCVNGGILLNRYVYNSLNQKCFRFDLDSPSQLFTLSLVLVWFAFKMLGLFVFYAFFACCYCR